MGNKLIIKCGDALHKCDTILMIKIAEEFDYTLTPSTRRHAEYCGYSSMIVYAIPRLVSGRNVFG